MRGWRGWVGVGALLVAGCAGPRAAATGQGTGGSGPVASAGAQEGGRPGTPSQEQPLGLPEQAVAQRRYVDARLGFQVDRPEGAWTLSVTNDAGEDGLIVPVVLRHDCGATVVLQVAPAVASPFQYAESLTRGLREQMGVVPGEVEPLPLSDNAVGFRFRMGNAMQGRVVVRDGGPGRVFMMLATWPDSAPGVVPTDVESIIGSIRPVQTI